MARQICLKWNNPPSIIDDFRKYFSTQTMVDVTVACDGKSLKAHKLVLSVCSPFLMTLLSENPCQHPIIILPDVKFTEVKAVLDCLYYGEISLKEENLAALIKCAATLRVKVLEDLGIEADKSESQLNTNQSMAEFEIQPGAVSASLSGNESEIPLPPLKTLMAGTPPPQQVTKEDETSDADCEAIGDGKLPALHDILNLQSNNTNGSQDFLFLEGSIDELTINETEDFEDLPISTLEKMLKRNCLPRWRYRSPKEQHQSNPGDSSKKQNNILPTPTLPVVLCEKMIRVKEDFTAPAASKYLESFRKEQNLKLKKKKVKKVKRPYVRIPLHKRKILYKIENTPSGQRFYHCNRCWFSTLYLGSLKRHIILKHNNLRPFKCDQCSYTAAIEQNLKRHLKEVHEQLRRFPCHLCTHRFAQRTHLKRHIKTVHEQKNLSSVQNVDFVHLKKQV